MEKKELNTWDGLGGLLGPSLGVGSDALSKKKKKKKKSREELRQEVARKKAKLAKRAERGKTVEEGTSKGVNERAQEGNVKTKEYINANNGGEGGRNTQTREKNYADNIGWIGGSTSPSSLPPAAAAPPKPLPSKALSSVQINPKLPPQSYHRVKTNQGPQVDPELASESMYVDPQSKTSNSSDDGENSSSELESTSKSSATRCSEGVAYGPLYTGPVGKPGKGNFVRANSKGGGSSKLINKGAGRGRNKGRHSDRRAIRKDGTVGRGGERDDGSVGRKMYGRVERSGVDVMDDYLDGKFQHDDSKAGKGKRDDKVIKFKDDGCVRCSRHNRKAKLCRVKKAGINKGKGFYVCPLPRGEGCDFFQWEMDTGVGIKGVLKEGGTREGWVKRKVREWKKRFGGMTIRELKDTYGAEGKRKEEIVKGLCRWVEEEIRKGGEGGTFREEIGEVVEKVEVEVKEREDEEGSEGSLEIEGEGKLWVGEEKEEEDEEDEEGEFEIENAPSKTRSTTTTTSTPTSPLTVLREYFHHSSFLPGQAWAINRVLSSNSSFLVASTGGGKSLCYALPALILPGLTIVVSPLISLMEDQIRRLPPSCISATLSGSLTKAEQAVVVDDLIGGRVKVLFVSPERLCSSAFKRLLRPAYDSSTRSYVRPLPPVSVLCVDEAHCLSQWSHNFRASYMRLRGILNLLKPNAVLALTATAGKEVIDDVCGTLGIPRGRVGEFEDCSLGEVDNPERGVPGKGVRVLSAERGNIDAAVMVVDGEEGRRTVVINMLKPGRKEREGRGGDKDLRRLGFERGCMAEGSTVVYVWTKRQAEAMCDLIKGSGVDGGVTYYHGGMSASDRSSSQNRFMKGKCRVIVATVAFGLGIDKGDVRGVIHACLPKSFEHYVQEIGRAGRDGEEAKARCVVIREDAVAQRSLSHGGGVERVQVERFLDVVKEATAEVVGDVPEEFREGIVFGELDVAVPVMEAVVRCDIMEETVETMVSLMEEEGFGRLLKLDGSMVDRVTVTMKKRPLEELQEPVAKCIVRCGTKVEGGGADNRLEELGGTAMDKGFFAYAKGNWKFGVVRVANAMGQGCAPRHVYAALRRLENLGELEVTVDTSARGRGFLVNLNKGGVECFREGKGRSEIEGKLWERMKEQEESAKKKVDEVWAILWKLFRDAKDEAGRKKGDGEGEEEEEEEEGEEKEKRMVERRKEVFSEIVVGYFQGKKRSEEIRNKLDGIKVPKINMAVIGDPEIRRMVRDANNLRNDQAFDGALFPKDAVTMNGRGCKDYAARAICNVLHGLDHPRLSPTVMWGMGEWQSWREFDYEEVLEACKKVFSVQL